MDSKLNSELLKAAVDEDEKKEPPKPKRNSKDELVEKICQVATSSGITLEYSDAKLKRMTKPQLNQVLADVIEQAMRDEMARQVGAKPGASRWARFAWFTTCSQRPRRRQSMFFCQSTGTRWMGSRIA